MNFFCNFAIKDGEITPSRQKKKRFFFVLLSTFRNFAAERLRERNAPQQFKQV